jgi:hypothetical protein
VLFQKEQPGDLHGRHWPALGTRTAESGMNTASPDNVESELTPNPDLDEIRNPVRRGHLLPVQPAGLGLVPYGEPAGGGAGWSGGGVAGEVLVAFSGSVFFGRFLVGPSLRQ